MKQLIIIIILLFISSCAPKRYMPIFTPASFSDLRDFETDDHLAALSSFLISCEPILKADPNKKFGKFNIFGKYKTWQKKCKIASSIKTEKQAKLFFKNHFTPYSVKNYSDRKGLFTGYYEPILCASKIKSKRFKYPIHKNPYKDKVINFYPSRAEIHDGVLDKKGLELFYTDDEIELFFLHIQGSGQLVFPDKTSTRIKYDGKNNHPYLAIGKVLKDEFAVPSELITANFIKKWLLENPEHKRYVLEQNPSYIFFMEHTSGGTIGAQGVHLTPFRSLAIDHKVIPYGTPIWLETTYPDGKLFRRLMLAQDTGGAIKGPVRGDVFFGSGSMGGEYASKMKQQGNYYVLIPNS